jgi:hypothetical protein
LSIPDHEDKTNNQEHEGAKGLPSVANPLAQPIAWKYGFQKRLKLFPWWLRYNFGTTKEAVLKDKIIQLGTDIGLQNRWIGRIVRNAVSEFSKKGLGSDYYGYHNINHELEAAYFTLMAVNHGRTKNNNHNAKFNQEDIKYLFVAALYHDYDPSKQFDKPHEDSVEWFLRNDNTVKKFIKDIGINIDIVIALIHRTAYPFKGKTAEYAKVRMHELFTSAGIAENDYVTRQHYERLGWFLSVSERIAGYALGNFEHAMELARRNAHALGWHPSLINEQSLKYFSTLKEEQDMVELVLDGIDDVYKNNFFNNVQAFKNAWQEEINIRDSVRKGEIALVAAVEEKFEEKFEDPSLIGPILNIYRELPAPTRINEGKFRKTLSDSNTILIILRVNGKSGEIVGYVKGGPLEKYELRRGTYDVNLGKHNTVYMEWISIKPGYWGATGGHLLRSEFLKEARRRRYTFVTSYVHRNVIAHRIKEGEKIEVVQRYNPDNLDYYRLDLRELANLELPPKILPADIGLDEKSPTMLE